MLLPSVKLAVLARSAVETVEPVVEERHEEAAVKEQAKHVVLLSEGEQPARCRMSCL
jgi:hypothetical protein